MGFARRGVAQVLRCAQLEVQGVASAFDAVAAAVAVVVAHVVSPCAAAISARNGGTFRNLRAAVAPTDGS